MSHLCIGPVSLIFANRFIPITAKMYKIRNISVPTFIKAGSVVTKVEKMTCSDFKFLNSFRIRPILNALIT